MPLRSREYLIAELDQCGDLDYSEMVDLLQSVLFYYEADGSGAPPPKFFGLWDQTIADTDVYDYDTYVSYGNQIYQSAIVNNRSIPGTNGDWVLQGANPIPEDIEFKIGDGLQGTPAVGTLTVQFPVLINRKIRIFRDGARKGTREYANGDGFTQPTNQGVVNVLPAWQPSEVVIIEIYK